MRLLSSGCCRTSVLGIALICPVLTPQRAFENINKRRLYRWYLLHLWKSMLAKKEKAFPDHYDFSECMLSEDPFDIMRHLLPYLKYNTVDSYLSDFAISQNEMNHIDVPVLILSSRDDQIIPHIDIIRAKEETSNPNFIFIDTRYGGHCGFRQALTNSESWAARTSFAFARCLDRP